MPASYQFSESTMLSIRIASSVLQFAGILLSLFRLWFRSRIKRLWWEDASAFVACVAAIVLLVTEWTYLGGGWEVAVVSFWIYALVLTLVVWAVRMSILFSVARIVHPSTNMRRIMMAIAASFGVMFSITMILKIWWFAADDTWLKQTSFYTRPARWMPHSLYIYELCSDCISDFILVALPVRMMWSMNLPTKQRRMIIAIFSSGVIVTAVSIFRAVSQFMNLSSLIGVAIDIEVALSIITCNLLVVVTVLYRVFQRRHHDVTDPENDDDYTTPVTVRITQTLTTIDFSVALESSGDSSKQANLEKSSSAPSV